MTRYRSRFEAVKSLLLPKLRFSFWIILIIGLLLILWKLQQNNLDSLNQKLIALEQDIKNLPSTISPKDKLGLEKDLLLLEKDRVNAQNAVYTTLIQALGGLFFFVTAYLTLRNVRATEQKQVTDRFSKAVEQLESDKLAVQLGGIYALERIAIDSQKDHSTIMEVLTSFVRLTSPNESQENQKPVKQSVQAALTVIGRRDFRQDQEGKKLDLSYAYLVKANLNGAFLRGANFAGTNLREANLENADIREVYLGEAILSRANLSGARLDKANYAVDLPVRRVDLSQAYLVKAKLIGARLTSANLSQADFNKADLRKAYLRDADCTGAMMGGADLTEADLSQANFSGANLDNAKLSGANLYKANFSRTRGLSPNQIKNGKDWERAIYDESFRRTLGLPLESED